jgi:hypothetical protein
VTLASFHLAVLVIGCSWAVAGAQTAGIESDPGPGVTFPLGERYRIGRYVPARLHSPPGVPATVAGPGAVGVELPDGNNMAPVLAVGPLHDLGIAVHEGQPVAVTQSLRPLEVDQRLVGVVTGMEDVGEVVAELFPSKSIIRVPVDRFDPLPGPALAWNSLDAVILDTASAARISSQQLETLRAAGTAVAIRTEAKPAGDWPWQRRGAWWVLPRDEAAVVDVIQPDRYAPAGDLAGASARSRQAIVALLACFAIAAIGVSLWRSRRAWIGVVALGLVAAAGVWMWSSTQPKSATLVVEQQSGGWRDRYTQHVARADGEVRHVIDGNSAAAWPILFSPNHAGDVNLTLKCEAVGKPYAFVAHLKRGQSLVFLERSPAAATPSPSPATAPGARTR